MLEFLPEDIRRGIEAAQKRAQRKGTRLSVHMGEAAFPILRLWETGFAVDPARCPRLRGLVDIFDGPRHISQALIIAASVDDGEIVYDFKRETVVADRLIRDYAEDRVVPGGYLTAPTS